MQYEVELADGLRLARAMVPRGRADREVPFPTRWISTVTGRAAMVHALSLLRKRGVLADRNAPILVPQWLCTSFLQLVQKHASPTLSLAVEPKVAVVYHQYGFPQDMDEVLDYADRKKITVIEDCANLYEGYYKGRRLGTFGWAAIFSLGKVFPSIWGGGLATADEELYVHACKQQGELDAPLVTYALYATKYVADRSRRRPSSWVSLATQMAYAVGERAQRNPRFSTRIAVDEIASNALGRRARNYRLLLERFSTRGHFDGLEAEGVYPYVAPFFGPEDVLRRVAASLSQGGFESGVYHFDVNRNVFRPRFVKCAWVPVHQGLTLADMHAVGDLIERAL